MSKMINQISVIIGLSIIMAMLATVFGADPQSSFWLSLIIIGGLVVPSANQTFRNYWAAPAGCRWYYLGATVIGISEFITRINIFVSNDLGAFFAIVFTIFSVLYFIAGHLDASGIPKLGATGGLLMFTSFVSLTLPVVEFESIAVIPACIGFFSVLISVYREKGFKHDRSH